MSRYYWMYQKSRWHYFHQHSEEKHQIDLFLCSAHSESIVEKVASQVIALCPFQPYAPFHPYDQISVLSWHKFSPLPSFFSVYGQGYQEKRIFTYALNLELRLSYRQCLLRSQAYSSHFH